MNIRFSKIKAIPKPRLSWKLLIVTFVFTVTAAFEPVSDTLVKALVSSAQQVSYTISGYVNGCGTMQGGTSDGQYLYFACATPSKSQLRIVKYTTDGHKVAESGQFSRKQLGHANDMTYNSKLKLLVVGAQDWGANASNDNLLQFIDPNTFELKDTKRISDGQTTGNLCYNSATDQYLIRGKVYDSNLKFTNKRVFTATGVDNELDLQGGRSLLNQGVECNSSYVYVMRVVFNQNGYNAIAVYDWSGNNIGVYKIGTLNDEGENMALVNGALYMGINEGAMSSGGVSANDYFLKLNGIVGAGASSNCESTPEASSSNYYRTFNNIPFTGGSNVCCNTLSSNGGLVGDTNAEKALNYLTSTPIATNGNKPLSPAQASGAVGNFMRESGGDTYNLKPDYTSPYGIVQWLGARWSNPSAKKITGLKEFADSKNADWKELQTQMDFIVYELNSAESAIVKDKTFQAVSNDEAGARSAAARWAALYERPGPPPYTARENNAAKAFNDFGSKIAVSTPTTSSTAASDATTLSASTTEFGGCSTSSNGYVFPLKASKADVRGWGNNPGTTEWISGRYHEKVFTGYYAVDIYAPEGTPVLAFHAGKVIHISTGSYGEVFVEIMDDAGYTYFYTHMSNSRGAQVKEGDTVDAGTLIGYVGNKHEGWDSVPHLHIDKSKNPGNGLRGACTASHGYCPIASENRFVKIITELHDSFGQLPDTGTSSL